MINSQTARQPSLAALLILLAATAGAFGQATDGDEQFQAYHQDIGRISGGAQHSSQVAPNTIVRQLPATSAPFSPPPLPTITTQQQQQPPRRQQQQQQQQPSRRPQGGNRVTLAVRTARPQVAAALAAPIPLAPALPEPAQYSPQPAAATFQPMQPAQPLSLAGPPRQLHQGGLGANEGEAAASFRASAGHSQSVSARHSALMAQVAAERQAALATAGAYLAEPPAAAAPPAQLPQHQASLGQPLEALSVQAPAQVQAPPHLSHHLAASSAAEPNFAAAAAADEPMVAPSFEHVLSQGCPRRGVLSYPNKDHCDRYYMCTNGTFTEEACPNGLAYATQGAVYQHCAYQWNVDCAGKHRPEAVSSPGCPWQFGIFPLQQAGRCSIDYAVCEWGVPETKRCQPEGLFYDDRIKGCQWADQLGCKSEKLLNFKCPAEDEDNPYWPFPRYYHTKQDVVVCVNEQPRLVHCNEDQVVDPSSLACMDLNKKKKKVFKV